MAKKKMSKVEKVEKILGMLPEMWRKTPITRTVIYTFMDRKQYIPLDEYNGILGFIVGLLYDRGLADILVVGRRIFFRIKDVE